MGAEAAAGAGLGAADPISLGLSAVQTGLGIYQTISGAAKMKKLLAQRTAYQTPDEIFKILNVTENMASTGYDPFTLNYLTGETERATASTLGTAARLGADPNLLSGILDQKIQATLKIGADNHALNMQNVGKYLTALSTVAENKAAEWKSKQDIIKDKMQAADSNMKSGAQNTAGGFNSLLSTLSSEKVSQLYTQMIGGGGGFKVDNSGTTNQSPSSSYYRRQGDMV